MVNRLRTQEFENLEQKQEECPRCGVWSLAGRCPQCGAHKSSLEAFRHASADQPPAKSAEKPPDPLG